MGSTRARTPIVSEEERADDESLNDSLKDAVAALVRSQKTLMDRMNVQTVAGSKRFTLQ
jgi:hypothetical protein